MFVRNILMKTLLFNSNILHIYISNITETSAGLKLPNVYFITLWLVLEICYIWLGNLLKLYIILNHSTLKTSRFQRQRIAKPMQNLFNN